MAGKKKDETASSSKGAGREQSKSPVKSKGSGRTKSPARSKSPGRTKSPARSKSPGRSKGKGTPKSSRSTQSPSRKSPSRTVGSGDRTKSPGRRSPGRTAAIKSVEITKTFMKSEKALLYDSESDNQEPVQEIKEKPKIAVRGRSRRLDAEESSVFTEPTDIDLKTNYIGVLRRSARTSQSSDLDRIVHLTKYDLQAQKLTEFSDEDEISQLKSSPEVEMKVAAPQKTFVEFGGTKGALSMAIFFPLYVFGLHVFCNESQCSFLKVNWRRYFGFSAFFHAASSLIYLGFAVSLMILSAIPFLGKRASALPNRQGKYEYVMNGFASCVLFMGVFVALEFYKIPVADFLVKHYFHFIFPSFVYGVMFSVYLYISSFYVPVSNLTTNSSLNNSRFYNFYMGRECNPRFRGIVDLKMYFFRLTSIAVVLILLAFFWKNVGVFPKSPEETRNFNLTFISLFTLIFVYIFPPLIFESAWLSTFEVQHEGLGYMSATGYTLYPFMITATLKYVHDYSVQLEQWQIAASIALFLAGYSISWVSNSQKDRFRRNPYSADVSHLESIPTPQGKKLLVSGYWGLVRHPNYLGEALVHLAFVPYVYNVPPVLFVFFTVFLLIHRTKRIAAHCKQRYGAAWDRYCQRVKYAIIPKVY